MKKLSIFLVITLGLVFYLKSLSLAQAPIFSEQLVYSLNVYDGKGYAGTFTPQTGDTIYLIANKDSAISARITWVYFWPTTAEFMAGWQTLNEELEGTLEILKERKLIKLLKKRDNALYYPRGYWGETSVLCIDKNAHTHYEKYKKAVDEYYKKISEYYKTRTEYRKKMDEFLGGVEEKRDVGVEGPLDIEIPKEPKPPEAPKFYVTEPRKDYIINLPVGRYQIRIRAEDGTIVQDSEKYLVVFASRRVGGIGYEIIRDNRWTLLESCSDPGKAIQGRGAKILYLRAYYQDEYNELYYNKLKDPQTSGNIDQWKWFNINPIKNVALLLLKEETEVERIERKPYYVKQIFGKGLRYNIIEFGQNKLSQHVRPTFEGYKLNLSSKDPGKYEIILLDTSSGELIEQSRKKLIID